MLTFDATPDELALFLQEAEEQLQLLDQDIVLLEKEGPRPELLQEIFRAAHTLKGSSAAIGHTKMARLTHAMESALDHLRQGRVECGTDLIDLLLQSLDGLRLLKEEVVELQDCEFDPTELVECLNDVVECQAAGVEREPAEAASHDAAQVTGERIPATEMVHLVVRIAEDSPLVAARCLQAYLEASRLAHILHSVPSLRSIESQDASHRLEMVVQPISDVRELVGALKDLPDVAEVVAEPWEPGRASAGLSAEGSPGGEAPTASGRSPDGSGSAPDTGGRAGGRRTIGLGKTVRIDVARLDEMMNLVGELVIDRTRLIQLGNGLRHGYDEQCASDLAETAQHMGRIVDELQESIMKARMLPVETLFNRLPRVVRDLAQRSGKKVDFIVEGKETELDRSVIEELHDPLVHLLRNAVDHGVETPDRRVARGKSEVGRIRLTATHRDNRIVIEVEDDGRGIDPQKIRETAVERGAISAEMAERLSDQEALELIFSPGFSTAEVVSDVSGRGVGMDIVRTNIEKLNGSIAVESRPGEGTRFSLELPLTLAILDALMVGTGDQVLAIPLVSVVETLRVRKAEIHRVNRCEVIQLRDQVLPLVRLDRALGLPTDGQSADRVFVVAVRMGDHRVGLVVDSLLGELQVVIKSLGRQVGNLAGVMGATILGDGRVALILDVPSLIKSVLDEQSRGWAA